MTTQPKTGTVTINGRVYTHKTRNGRYAREIDLISYDAVFPRVFAVLEDEGETSQIYTDELKYHYFASDGDSNYDLTPIPAPTTRPRKLKDITAELAKGGGPWVSSGDEIWYLRINYITQLVVEEWNKKGYLFSPNPFKENPTIIYPEITEGLKP